MEPQKVVAYLQQIPLFENLTDERGELLLYHVAEVVQERMFAKGQWLFGQGDIIDGLYLIIAGNVRLTRIDRMGVTYQVADKGPGTIFGEDQLLMGDFHDHTVVASESVKALFISREDFKQVYEEHPYLRRKINLSADVQKRRDLLALDWVRDGEWVIFAVRRHWVRLVRRTLPPLLLVMLMLPVFAALLLSEHTVFRYSSGVLALPILGVILLLLWSYFDWRNDVFALTTQRVVHIERVWPFREHFAETVLDNIEDIYEVRPGLAANLLDYGDLVLQTAGETVHIDMEQVPNTGQLREVIFREIERSKARKKLHAVGAIRETLAKRLETKPAAPTDFSSPPTSPPLPARVPLLQLVVGAIGEYFFPSSWLVSSDGGTIIWRRFWAAGFVQHLKISIPLIILTIGGAVFILANATHSRIAWVLVAWLFLETILFGLLLWFIEDWRNDYFELTPSRMILVMQKPLLLQESRKETTLDNIQNISFEVPSMLARVLDYGHVMLETAGTQGKFSLRWLRHPQKVQQAISRRQREFVQSQDEAESQQRQEELLSWFATYDNLRKNGDEETLEVVLGPAEITPDTV